MKTLLSLLLSCYLILINCASLNAQWVTIPDANFVNWLNANIPQCMNGNQMDIMCAGVVNRTFIGCSGQGITDLTGIEYFNNLKELQVTNNMLITLPLLPQGLSRLIIEQNQFTSLPQLPQGLAELYCGRNPLTNLSNLPPGLTQLDCSLCDLTSLPNLPPGLRGLTCDYNELTSLPPLPSGLENLECFNNQLTTLPSLPSTLLLLQCGWNPFISFPTILLPSGLKHLTCPGLWLTSLPLLPSGLEELTCSYNQLASLPPLPLGLSVLDCSHNQLTILPEITGLVNSPPRYPELYCSYNQLTSIPELPDYIFILNCSDNPTLSCLPELKRIGRITFTNTAITCLPNYGDVTNSTPPLNSLPICDSANANGCAVFALNISGFVISETGVGIPGATVTLSGIHSQTTTTLSDGSYSFLVDKDGDYTVTPSKNNDVTTNNGISTSDVLLTRRHLLGILPLPSPYKIIAADVDGSSTVTTLDILLTRQMILQMTTTFPNGRLWQFVPSDYVFADIQNPFPFPTTRTYTNLQQSVTGQDFIGIKLGDVNDSWDATIP